MWMALSRLEKQVQSDLPELSESVAQSKDKLFALLNPTGAKECHGCDHYRQPSEEVV